MNGIGIKRIGWAFDVSSVCSTIANSPINFFFIERECIDIIYCQYYPAIWDVISATSQNELENTPPSAICTLKIASGAPGGRIFQHIPSLGSVL